MIPVLKSSTTKTLQSLFSNKVGLIFEYRDEKAYKECQPIWQEIERLNPETPAKIFANRGIVLDNNVLSD